MDKLANDAQLDSKDTRYTDEINQKTGLNDWQARTWALQDVIGVVADNVGTGKVLSGLGFFSKISTGMSALLVQDYPGGHIRKEPKL